MSDVQFMRLALRLARHGYGATSPNPMVGAVLVKKGKIIGRGWHRRAGEPHAEVEAIRDAQQRGNSTKGATLHVTLEPCCTQGRTPPCTAAIIAAGIARVVVGATDPNPRHAGKGFAILQQAGVEVTGGILARECARLNEAFNHWIVQGTPFVTVKAAMTLDGKIATASGESKWITGEQARAYGMKLRQGSDAVLVGINTVLADDPALTVRGYIQHSIKGPRTTDHGPRDRGNIQHSTFNVQHSRLRRFVLDSRARTPLTARIVSDEHAALTTVIVSQRAPRSRVAALAKRVNVWTAPATKSPMARRQSPINVRWLLTKLGSENVSSLLVEGGGEANATFLMGGFAHRVAFFYAPKILGGRDSRPAVGGIGAGSLDELLTLTDIEWRKLGPDLLLTARVAS